MTQKIKSALLRFARGFASGALSAMVIIVPGSMGSWGDLSTWIGALSLAGVFGGITGAILAIDKYIRDLKSEN